MSPHHLHGAAGWSTGHMLPGVGVTGARFCKILGSEEASAWPGAVVLSRPLLSVGHSWSNQCINALHFPCQAAPHATLSHRTNFSSWFLSSKGM